MKKGSPLRTILILISGIVGWILVFNMKSIDLKYGQQDERELYVQMGSPKPQSVGEMLDLMDTFEEEFYVYRGPVWMYDGYLLLNHKHVGTIFEFLSTQGIAMRVFITDINSCSGEYQDIHFVLYRQVDVENNQWEIVQDLPLGNLNFERNTGSAVINIEGRLVEFSYYRDNTPNDCDQSILSIEVLGN